MSKIKICLAALLLSAVQIQTVRAQNLAVAIRNAIKLAVANKIKIALGTDGGAIPYGTNSGHEFSLMVEWGGMTPMQSIVAGT